MSRSRTPEQELTFLLFRTVCTARGCLEWQGYRQKGGYGMVTFQGRQWLCHRLVKTLVSNAPLPDDKESLHSCDNPPCINPAHIILGSHAKNMREMVDRERTSVAKISKQDVEEIKRRYSTGELQRDIGADFGITQSNVSYITNDKTWVASP